MSVWLAADTPVAGILGIVTEHLDGTAWYRRRRPLPWHRCRPVSRRMAGRWLCAQTERCACGAWRQIDTSGTRVTVHPWRARNSRWRGCAEFLGV